MNEPPNPEVAVFAAALELPADQRGAYLDQACAGDDALRRQVESLLRVHDDAGNFFDKLASVAQPTSAEGAMPGSSGTIRLPGIPSEKAGDRIGRYKLLQQIGEGGCGVVYMAEQEEPVRRRVALKVIKLGMDTKSVIARFEAERQALALMDHPNIAKVLDAGATETGRPYFVMELVRGIKITDYCDQNNLGTTARLELFIQVCQAIQHAHQKGIIHRDIKPSNILVTVNDGVAVPKVIDFGIAKATQGRLTDHTLFTAFEQFLGTPAYMSPEQAEMTSLDIDTRSDVYSLGVLLYELLTGQTPFDAKELLQAGLDEIRRTIREKEPARPSTRFSTMLGAELACIAKNRKVEPLKLVHLVRGDLDWIVMKALEKDRTRRYETASGLAADVKRHLSNEAVVACPPGNLYKLRKLVRRNKLTFTAVGGVAGALILGLAVAMWQFVEKSRAEREQSHLRVQAEIDKHKAQTEAAKSRQVAQFLKDMLQGVGPSVALGRDTTLLREILDKTAERMSQNLKDQPEVEADLQSTIAQVYFALEQFEQAELMHREALKIRKKLFGDKNLLVAASLYDLSDALLRQPNQPKKQTEAGILLEEALAIQRKLEGNESQDVARSLNNLAFVFMHEGKLAEAEALFRESLATRRRLLGNGHSDVAWSLQGLGEVLLIEGKPAAVEPLAREALTIRQKLYGTEHPDVAVSIDYLARVIEAQGKLAEVEPLYRQALAMRRKLFGGGHAETANAVRALGEVLYKEHKLPEAEQAFREALTSYAKVGATRNKEYSEVMGLLRDVLMAENKTAEVVSLYQEVLAAQRSALGKDSPTVATTLSGLASYLQLQGKQAEAEKALRETLDITLKLIGQDSTSLPALLRQEAQTLDALGKAPEAEKLFENAINAGRLKLSETNPILGDMLHDYGEFLNHQGNMEAAADNYIKSLPIRRTQQDDGLAWTLRDLGGVLNQLGRYGEAEAYVQESLALYRKLHRPDDVYGTGWTGATLGYALWQQHKLPEAERAYRGALSVYTKLGAVGSADYTDAAGSLLKVLMDENKLAEGETVCREILAQQRAVFTNDNPIVAQTLTDLADNLAAQGNPAEAEKVLREALQVTQQAVGSNPKRSDDLTKLGHLQWQLGQLLLASHQTGEAGRLFQQALQVFETAAIAFPSDPYLRQEQAFSHRLLGLAMDSSGNWAESERHYRAAIGLYEALEAGNPKSVVYLSEGSYTVWMLAFELDHAGHLEKAAAEFQQASALHRKGRAEFPDAHEFQTRGVSINISFMNLLLRMKRYDEAEQACRDALEISAKSKTLARDECASAVQSMVEALKSDHRTAEAEKFLNEVSMLEPKTVGQRDITVGITLFNLANLLQAQNKIEEATSRYHEAMNVLSNAPTEPKDAGWMNAIAWDFVTAVESPRGGAAAALELAQKAAQASRSQNDLILDTLAAAYAMTGQFTNAVRAEQDAIALAKDDSQKSVYTSRLKLYELNRPYRDRDQLAVRAMALLDEGKFAEAEPVARECLALREEQIPDDWRTFNARSMLGGSLLGQRKYAEAEPLLLSGYEGMKQREVKIPPEGKARLNETLRRLSQLYDATKRPDQAVEWKKKLAELELNKNSVNPPP